MLETLENLIAYLEVQSTFDYHERVFRGGFDGSQLTMLVIWGHDPQLSALYTLIGNGLRAVKWEGQIHIPLSAR